MMAIVVTNPIHSIFWSPLVTQTVTLIAETNVTILVNVLHSPTKPRRMPTDITARNTEEARTLMSEAKEAEQEESEHDTSSSSDG